MEIIKRHKEFGRQTHLNLSMFSKAVYRLSASDVNSRL